MRAVATKQCSNENKTDNCGLIIFYLLRVVVFERVIRDAGCALVRHLFVFRGQQTLIANDWDISEEATRSYWYIKCNTSQYQRPQSSI